MIGAKWFDPIIGVDIHFVLVPAPPAPVPIPAPLPHPFVGVVFDPAGMLIGAAISLGAGFIFGGPRKGVTLINKSPAAATGTEGTNKMVMPHFPMPPGVGWAPVPAGIKPPIPHKEMDPIPPGPIPSMDAVIITGSKTVYIGGANASRLGDLAMSCGEPIRLPSSTILAIPLGPPVLIGGPPALDFMAALMSMIKTSWVSDRLHALLKAPPGSWRSKIICFLTGHPVDVATGMMLTDAVDLELPGPIPFKMERTYYSRSTYNGPLGYGWAHSYDQFIRFEEHRIVLHDGDGREIYFDNIPVDSQTRNHTERMTLFRKSSEVIICTKENLLYRFTECGRNTGDWHLYRIDDFNNSSIKFTYDESGFLVGIIDSAGRVIKYINDDQGRLTALLAPHPSTANEYVSTRRYGYNLDGDLSVVKDALDQPFTYKYKYHLMVQETNRNGLSFYFAYDGIDQDARCVRTWGDDGIYDHVIVYDTQNHVTIVENSLGHKTTYLMDATDAVVKVVDARSGETSFTYDEYDRKTSETDPLGNETRFVYDQLGNIVETIDADGTTVSFTYNDYSLPVLATDKLGGLWQWKYDGNLRVTERTDPLERKTRFMYTGKSLSSLIDPAGQSTGVSIDPQGNLLMAKNPDGSIVKLEYNRIGQCYATTDPKSNRKVVHFDTLGRVATIDEPDGNTLQFSYDPEGNITNAKDKRYDVGFLYKGMNRLVTRKQNGTEVSFLYDTEENLTEIRNEYGGAYSFTLDACGEVLIESGFDAIKRVYARNSAGWIERVDRPDYNTTNYTYDKIGRITGISHGDDCTDSYAYREDGSLLEATNNSATVTFVRDPLGRVIDELQNGYRVSSEYDSTGNRVQLSSSLGANIHIGRNQMGDTDSLTVKKGATESTGESSLWESHFTRDQLGLELQCTMSGGLTRGWERDTLGRPVHQTISAETGYSRIRTYEWDVNNRLKSINDSLSGKTLFQHDPLGNLAAAISSDGTTIFRMPDALGNLFRTKERTDRKYGPAGQLLEAQTQTGIVTYEYDSEGNLVKKNLPDGTAWEYHWNGAGMLEKVLRPDGDAVTFTYDALGRRISKTFMGKTTRWVWDGNVLLHEWVEVVSPAAETSTDTPEGDDGTIQNHFTQIHYTGRPAHAPPLEQQGSEKQPITWVFEPESFAPIARIIGEEYHNIVSDHLGTPLAMFNKQGEKVWSMELDIYGQVSSMDGRARHCPFRYPGQYEDEETGLYYNRSRYYDPQSGQYASQDPIGLLGYNPNIYGYVKNPITWIDPLGLDCMQKRLGDFGEDWAKEQLEASGKYSKVFKVQNASGHGIDLVGMRFDGKFDFFEVKTNISGIAGDLSARQSNAASFISDILGSNKAQAGGFGISPAEAQHMLNNIGDTRVIDVFVGRNGSGWIVNNGLMSIW